MDLRLLVLVVCCIRLSEATITLSAITGTASIASCAASGVTVTYSQPTPTGGTTPYTYSTTFTQTPDTTPKLFAVSSAGAVTTAAMSCSFAACSYDLGLTVQDNGSPALTSTFTLTVAVTGCSGADVMMPSLVVLSVSVLSLFLTWN